MLCGCYVDSLVHELSRFIACHLCAFRCMSHMSTRTKLLVFLAVTAGLSEPTRLPVHVPAGADAFAGDMTGVHLHITAVHDDQGMGMFAHNGSMLPWMEWRGFQRDVIDWVAARAGFTYTLHSPSGDGPACSRQVDGSKFPIEQYSSQYNCAGDDVAVNNYTHAVWAMAYITPGRLVAASYTVPIISDVGIQLLVKKKPPSMWEASLFIYTPFSARMWLLFCCTVGAVMFVMYFVDHGAVDPEQRVAQTFPSHFRGEKNSAHQYLTWKGFRKAMPYYAIKTSMVSLRVTSAIAPRTASSSCLNLALCLFSMVIMTIYGAKLTASLTLSGFILPVASLYDVSSAQLANGMGPVCSLRGAAYTSWVQAQFPDIELNLNARKYVEMIAEVEEGRCDAMVAVSPTARVRSSRFLNLVSNERILEKGPEPALSYQPLSPIQTIVAVLGDRVRLLPCPPSYGR